MELAGLVAVLVSPLVAVLVSMWLQDRKATRERQLSILGTLIGMRQQPFSPEAVRALNMIDLVFHNESGVRNLWHEYYDMLCNDGLNNPNGWKQRDTKNNELITEMARALGMGKAISHLDVDRAYSPVGVWEQAARTGELQEELIRVLKATARLSVEQREEPPG